MLGDNVKSIWQASNDLPQFDSLKEDIKTDVLIIGGGIAGILCAYMLKKEGVECVVAEGGRICSGTSAYTSAKITSQHGLIYQKLIKMYGMEFAKKYYLANESAVAKYREMCRGTDCDFEDKSNYIYSISSPSKIEDELCALEKIGASNAKLSISTDLPFKCCGAVEMKNQAQFDPVKFVNSIIGDIKIYEHTPIRAYDSNDFCSDRASIKAKSVIVATHFPIWNKHGMYWSKLYQNRSYFTAVKNTPCIDGMYMDEDTKGLSFRQSGNYLLIGGGAHRTGKSGGGWAELERAVKNFYPSSQVKYRWAAQDCMSLDGVPYIGKYSKRTDNMFVATGFNKWGMTSSMISALLLTDLVLGRHNEFEDVFSPSRSALHLSLASNAFHSVCGLLTPKTPRCPHLGCALKYNRLEHSWDCPCHGSRFAESDGKLINSPATDDMTQKKLRRP